MRPHILIVEDDLSLSELYGMYLERGQFGYTITNFVDDALQVLSTRSVDAMLVDVNLNEDASGLDLIANIRRNPNYDKIKIITLTSFPERYDQTLQLGISLSLNKPIKYEELIAILKELLDLS